MSREPPKRAEWLDQPYEPGLEPVWLAAFLADYRPVSHRCIHGKFRTGPRHDCRDCGRPGEENQ